MLAANKKARPICNEPGWVTLGLTRGANRANVTKCKHVPQLKVPNSNSSERLLYTCNMTARPPDDVVVVASLEDTCHFPLNQYVHDGPF